MGRGTSDTVDAPAAAPRRSTGLSEQENHDLKVQRRATLLVRKLAQGGYRGVDEDAEGEWATHTIQLNLLDDLTAEAADLTAEAADLAAKADWASFEELPQEIVHEWGEWNDSGSEYTVKLFGAAPSGGEERRLANYIFALAPGGRRTPTVQKPLAASA